MAIEGWMQLVWARSPKRWNTVVTLPRPESDINLFSDEVLSDPYPHYREVRDLAAAVWLRPTGMFALSRYDYERDAMRDVTAHIESEAEGLVDRLRNICRSLSSRTWSDCRTVDANACLSGVTRRSIHWGRPTRVVSR